MDFQRNLPEYISESLMTMGKSISIAESVTSGCLQLAFSQMLKGGMTTYSLPEKVRLLKVNRRM